MHEPLLNKSKQASQSSLSLLMPMAQLDQQFLVMIAPRGCRVDIGYYQSLVSAAIVGWLN
jgi:hypothetical protein